MSTCSSACRHFSLCLTFSSFVVYWLCNGVICISIAYACLFGNIPVFHDPIFVLGPYFSASFSLKISVDCRHFWVAMLMIANRCMSGSKILTYAKTCHRILLSYSSCAEIFRQDWVSSKRYHSVVRSEFYSDMQHHHSVQRNSPSQVRLNCAGRAQPPVVLLRVELVAA